MIQTTPRDCASEPITKLGAIQSHGLLFALNTDSLEIEQVSSNSQSFLGIAPDDLLSLQITRICAPSQTDKILQLIQEAAQNYINPFDIDVLKADGSLLRCHGIAHAIDHNITLLEFEPLIKTTDTVDSLDNYFNLVQKSLQQTINLTTLDEVASLMATQVKEFTGFDRVMVYRFAPDHSGTVIAEASEEGMEPFLGLRFPAGDIPAQARALYLKNWVRLLHDTDAEVADLVPTDHPRISGPLPLDKSVLRAMSPIHLQYLRNMGVRSSLSVSLIVDDKLWGLISCHHRTPRFVSYGIRSTSSLYGTVMSAQLSRTESKHLNEQFEARCKALNSLVNGLDPLESSETSFAACLPSLLKIFKADGAAIVTDDHVVTHGNCPSIENLRQVTLMLPDARSQDLVLTDSIRDDYAELAPLLSQSAGLIAIKLDHLTWMILLRAEQALSISWGGNPSSGQDGGEHSLAPRNSFSEWIEQVEGKSEPWPEDSEQLVDEFRSGLSGFIISRNRLLETSNEELRQFASVIAHEVKSQIQPSLMALSLIKESHPEDKIGTMVDLGVNSLTTLSKFTTEMIKFAHAEESGTEMENVNFNELAKVVTKQAMAAQPVRNVSLQINPLPTRKTSPSQTYHLMLNLVRNALIHGPKKGQDDFQIEIGCQEDELKAVFYVRDNGKGIPEDEHSRIFDYFYRGSSNKDGVGTGIGLSFVQRLLEKTNDRIWVESKLNEGATFFFTVGSAAE